LKFDVMLNSDVWNLKVRFQTFDFCFLVGYPILEGIIGIPHHLSAKDMYIGTQYLLTVGRYQYTIPKKVIISFRTI
jgi:hypothetical protein